MKRFADIGRWWVLVITLSLCVSAVPTGGVASAGSVQDGPGACAPSGNQPANGTTVIAVQGAKFTGDDSGKRPARLVALGPKGGVQWVYQSHSEQDVSWQYDVDPMANGHVFVTAATKDGKTRVFELNPKNQQVVWEKTFDFLDTHDADLIDNGSKIVLANMRNAKPKQNTNDDRIVVYDRQKDRIVWEWYFKNHFDRSVGGNYSEDWTHVNDVDAVGDDRFIISPRNFDQVLVINRTTKEVDMELGAYGNHSVLRKQHNPDYLESENGTPTILVADSDNDRIVEYAKEGNGWNRTWTLGGSDSLSWPRDADRLANGNTLVTDSVHNRVVEVTPTGEIVWEGYAPWLVYDAARLSQTNESGGPTIAGTGAAGDYALKGGSGMSQNESALRNCAEVLRTFDNSAGGGAGMGNATPTETTDREAKGDGTGTARPDGTTGSAGQPGFTGLAALVAMAGAALLARYRR